MATTGVGSEILANRLFTSLVGELNSQLPGIDLYDETHTIPWDKDSAVFKPVEKLSIEELVTYFHSLMGGFNTHLSQEYEKGRITGAEYSKTYIALTQAAMAGAVQFALGKDQAFWLAAKTQADAITAHNQNEVVRLEAKLRLATYALTKLQLASTDSTFGVSELQRTDVLPGQVLLTQEQTKMVSEQSEAQRAQTLDQRSDGADVTGLIGKQRELYSQQKISYQEDVKVKAAKIFADLWTVQKTINEGTGTPVNAQEPAVNDVLTVMRASAGVPLP